jgi:hypothetical protein
MATARRTGSACSRAGGLEPASHSRVDAARGPGRGAAGPGFDATCASRSRLGRPRQQRWRWTCGSAALHSNGRSVAVSLVGDTSRMPSDAAQALGEAQTLGWPSSPGLAPRHARICTWTRCWAWAPTRAPTGPLAPPSGAQFTARFHPGGGPAFGPECRHRHALMADCAVRAQNTLALLSLKPGCHTGQGRDHAGTVWLDRLGVPASGPTAWLSGAPQATDRLHAAHKGSFGDVAVVGGAPGHGRRRLAGRARGVGRRCRARLCLLAG